MRKFQPYAIMLLAGLIYTLGHPNVLGVLLPFTPIFGSAILIYFLINAKTLKSAISFYLTFNLMITIFSFYWITATLQEFGNLPFILAAIANLGYVFMFCPQYWLFIILIYAIKKYRPQLEPYFFRDGLFSVLVAAFLTTTEYFIPQQFPIMLGQPWIVLSDYLGLASIFGLPLFSFMSYVLSIEFIRYFKVKRISYFNIMSLVVLIIANIIFANIKYRSFKDEKLHVKRELEKSFNIRVVQANISNFLKLESEGGNFASVDQVLNAYKELSLEPFQNNERIDLIIWPETAYPYPIRTNKEDLTKTNLPPLFGEIIQVQMSELLIGGYDRKKESLDQTFFMTEYNTAFFIDSLGNLKETFHKHILIPFGETLPLGPLNKWASKMIPEMAFFARGEKFPLFETERKIKFITTICYELIKPEFIRNYLNSVNDQPQILINLTNDSWYGNTVEPEQHLFLTKWRSIEFDLPIIRSTNTGISSYIDWDGREQRRLNYHKTGNLDLQLTIGPTRAPTMYQKYGFLNILPLWLLYFIFHLLLIKLKHAKTNANSN